MKLFNQKLTIGGFLGICGVCFAIIAGLVLRAFGVHKIIGGKVKKIKAKIFDQFIFKTRGS